MDHPGSRLRLTSRIFWQCLVDNLKLDYLDVDLGADTTICYGEKVTLNAFVSGATAYRWSTGSTVASIRVNEPGTYWVEVSNGCETKRDTIEIYRIPELKVDLLPDTVLCIGATLSLDVSNEYATYEWNTGSPEPTVMIDQPGIYTVTVNNRCQTITQEIAVDFQLCCFEEDCCALTIPNVFTPNADHWNDTFVITSTHQPSFYELTIFNRWGETVYKSDQLNAYWNGQMVGREAAAGLYYYQIRTICPFLNKTVQREYKGWVQWLRKKE